MNNEEARFLLCAYRPDGEDAQDAQFAEALKQAENDPALAAWLREQQAFDTAVKRKLHAVPVPTDLKAGILAGRRTIRPAAWWKRLSVTLPLAACFAFLLALAAFWMWTPAKSGPFAAYRSNMVALLANVEARPEQLEHPSQDIGEIQSWLRRHSSQTNLAIPSKIRTRTGLGCRVLKWQGHCVTLVCFTLDDGQAAHLLVTTCQALPDAPKTGERLIASAGDMNTVAWSSGTRTYLLVSHADARELEALL